MKIYVVEIKTRQNPDANWKMNSPYANTLFFEQHYKNGVKEVKYLNSRDTSYMYRLTEMNFTKVN